MLVLKIGDLQNVRPVMLEDVSIEAVKETLKWRLGEWLHKHGQAVTFTLDPEDLGGVKGVTAFVTVGQDGQVFCALYGMERAVDDAYDGLQLTWEKQRA